MVSTLRGYTGMILVISSLLALLYYRLPLTGNVVQSEAGGAFGFFLLFFVFVSGLFFLLVGAQQTYTQDGKVFRLPSRNTLLKKIKKGEMDFEDLEDVYRSSREDQDPLLYYHAVHALGLEARDVSDPELLEIGEADYRRGMRIHGDIRDRKDREKQERIRKEREEDEREDREKSLVIQSIRHLEDGYNPVHHDQTFVNLLKSKGVTKIPYQGRQLHLRLGMNESERNAMERYVDKLIASHGYAEDPETGKYEKV